MTQISKVAARSDPPPLRSERDVRLAPVQQILQQAEQAGQGDEDQRAGPQPGRDGHPVLTLMFRDIQIISK